MEKCLYELAVSEDNIDIDKMETNIKQESKSVYGYVKRRD